ncbi:MAG: hypothetical protein M3M89_07150, partial [Thermoproteota archaeon]|nr:hypothetical protein [Thermoproteota archaeon]
MKKEREKEIGIEAPHSVSQIPGATTEQSSSSSEKLDQKAQTLKSLTPSHDSTDTSKKIPAQSQKETGNVVPSVSSTRKREDHHDKNSELEIKQQQKNDTTAQSQTTSDGGVIDHTTYHGTMSSSNSSSLPRIIKQVDSYNGDAATTNTQGPSSESEQADSSFALDEKRNPDLAQPRMFPFQLGYNGIDSNRDLVNAERYGKENNNNYYINDDKKKSSNEISHTKPPLMIDKHKQEGGEFSGVEKEDNVSSNPSARSGYDRKNAKVIPTNPDSIRHLPSTIHFQQHTQELDQSRSEIVVTVNIGRIDIKTSTPSERKSLTIKSEFSPPL